MTRNLLHVDDPQSRESQRSRGGPAISPLANIKVTYETGAWCLLAVAAILMRLSNLGFAPLSNSEARIALECSALTRGDAITAANPLYCGIQSVVMSVFGTGNVVVRLVTALAGIWLCVLPVLARGQLGRSRTLVFSFILTLSPTLWYASRQAEGPILAWALAGTALLTLLQGHRRFSVICIGILVACGQDAISPFLVIAISLLVAILDVDFRSHIKPSLADTMSGIIAFVLSSTMFLMRPSGLGDAFNGVATWASMLVTIGNFGLLRVVSGLLVYEPLLLLSTLIGVTMLVLQQRFNRLDVIWIAWIVAGLSLLLIDQSRTVADMLPLVIGCAALATHVWTETINAIYEKTSSPLAGLVVCGISIVMFVYAYLGLSIYAEQQQSAALLSIILGLIMIAGTGVVCTLLADGLIALRSITLALGICLAVYTSSVGFQLTQVRATNPAEPYVDEATDGGVQYLLRAVETASLRAFGDPTVMPLQVLDVAPPALRWALRDQHNVTYVAQLSDGAAALTPNNVKPQNTGTYVGSLFRVTAGASLSELRCQAAAADAHQPNCIPLVRWFTKRAVDEKLVTKWILWLSSDTATRASGIQ